MKCRRNVRFGSFADILQCSRHVHSTPESGQDWASEICILRTAKSRAQFKIELVSTSRLRKTGIFQILGRGFRQKFQILRRYRARQRLGNTEKAPNVRAFSRTFGTNITRAELGAGVAVQIVPCSAGFPC